MQADIPAFELITAKGIDVTIGVCGHPEHAATEAELLAGAVEAARGGSGVVIAASKRAQPAETT